MDFDIDQTVRHLLEPEIPVDAFAGRQEHVLGNAEGTACDGNQPSKSNVALLSRSDCSTVILDKNLDGLETSITCSRQP